MQRRQFTIYFELMSTEVEIPFSSRAFNALLEASIVQASNRATGAAMSILKKSDAKKHLSVSRVKVQHSLRPVCHTEGTNFSEIESRLASANPLPFVEDFNLEHSFSGVCITRIVISSRSDFAKSRTPRNPRASDLNSPNCVYIG